MNKQAIRDKLTLKKVGLEHIDQFNQLLRYVFQVSNEELQKSGYEDGELVRSKRPMLERSDVFGWFNGQTLVSQVCVYPCEVNIHGRICKMGGLTGVGTYPEYSGMGLMNGLIHLALQNMRKKGQLISYLFPYSIPYYRHKGWEILSDHISYTVKDHQIPRKVELPGFVERRPIDHPDVLETYDKFARQTHGAMIRGAYEWGEYWRWENEEERIAAVYYDEAHTPTGHIIYWVDNDIFHIKEMIYLNQESRRGLWNFIGAHHSMIDEVKGHNYKNEPLAFYLEDSQIVETIEPYFMARIVDVKPFLENFPFTGFAGPISFKVTDPIAPWNNGTFSLTGFENGKNIVENIPVGRTVKLNIQTLTAMLMRYRAASYLAGLERIQTDPETILMLESIIPNQQPYFSDYF